MPEVAEVLANYREFERLGGMKGLADAGFDMDKFETGFGAQILALKQRRQLNEADTA